MKTILLLGVTLLFVLSACTPPANVAETNLGEQIQTESGGHIKLVSFTKTDGQSFQVNGIQAYRVSFTGEIEFDANGTWSCGGNGPDQLSFGFTPGVRPAQGGIAGLLGWITADTEAHQGGRVKITGTMAGTKSENGWHFQRSESRVVQ